MFTKETLLQDIAGMNINPKGTLLIHSSLKAIGPVEGGAETVLDAWSEYMQDGLLIFPTHTWRQIGKETLTFDSRTLPSCVGILPELFRHRPGVVRSLHPTHSMAALGQDAASYTAGEETRTTPCPREGCWGKLLDRDAEILFLGCTLRSNTFFARRGGMGEHSGPAGRKNRTAYHCGPPGGRVPHGYAPAQLFGLRGCVAELQ